MLHELLSDIIYYLCNRLSCVFLVGDFNLHALAVCLHENGLVLPSHIILEDALCSHFADQIAYYPSRDNIFFVLSVFFKICIS